MDKQRLLDRCGVPEPERPAMRRVLDHLSRMVDRDTASATDFLTPAQQTQAGTILRTAGIAPEQYRFWGGYGGAERQTLLFFPAYLTPAQGISQAPIRCLRAAFRREEGLCHRDFLGSLTALGIVREKVGDILVSPDSADVLVLDTVADFLLQNWQSAGRAALRLREIDPGDVQVPQAVFLHRRDTVSSLRLDAVCAAAIQVSRRRSAELIAAGRVQLQGQVCTKPDRPVMPGAQFTIRGGGKFALEETGSPTKKGRIPITIKSWQ